MRVNTQLAYILHKRAFRETSQILDVFTREHGRLSLLSRGSRNPRAKTNGVLQAFRPLLLGWQGRGELPVVCSIDTADIRVPRLAGRSLMSAMYMNELLVYLLHRNDVHEAVFDLYHESLYALQTPSRIEAVLRIFEKNLLLELGFGLNLLNDADSGEPIEEDGFYVFHFEHGPVACAEQHASAKNPVLSGASLQAYARDQLESSAVRAEIKTLMRYVLQHQLGPKKLKSRELFRRAPPVTG